MNQQEVRTKLPKVSSTLQQRQHTPSDSYNIHYHILHPNPNFRSTNTILNHNATINSSDYSKLSLLNQTEKKILNKANIFPIM